MQADRHIVSGFAFNRGGFQARALSLVGPPAFALDLRGLHADGSGPNGRPPHRGIIRGDAEFAVRDESRGGVLGLDNFATRFDDVAVEIGGLPLDRRPGSPPPAKSDDEEAGDE